MDSFRGVLGTGHYGYELFNEDYQFDSSLLIFSRKNTVHDHLTNQHSGGNYQVSDLSFEQQSHSNTVDIQKESIEFFHGVEETLSPERFLAQDSHHFINNSDNSLGQPVNQFKQQQENFEEEEGTIDNFFITGNQHYYDHSYFEEKGHSSTDDSFHIEKNEMIESMGQEHQLLITPVPQQPRDEEIEEDDEKAQLRVRNIQKHRKNISKCTHSSEQYYANGMCKNCYHAKGRTKKASACEHGDRALYAKGLCKNCYLSIYHKKKRSAKKSNSSVSSASALDI